MEQPVNQFVEFLKYLAVKISSGAVELGLFLITFFSPAATVLVAVGFATLVDTYYGRRRARKFNKKVTSKRTRLGLVNKSIGYFLVILGVFLVDTAVVNELVVHFFSVEYATTKIIGLVFCWIEYTSVNESFTDIHGKSIGETLRSMVKKVKVVKEDFKSIKK